MIPTELEAAIDEQLREMMDPDNVLRPVLRSLLLTAYDHPDGAFAIAKMLVGVAEAGSIARISRLAARRRAEGA